jgi:hypothetical protein
LFTLVFGTARRAELFTLVFGTTRRAELFTLRGGRTWYSFLSEGDLTPGLLNVDRMIKLLENFQ